MSEFSDYYLSFPDEQTSFAIAESLGIVVTTEDGPRLVRFTERYAIDVIGIIEIAGTYDHDGNIIEAPVVLPGWHVNLRILDGSSMPADVQQYVVTPATPYRVWA